MAGFNDIYEIGRELGTGALSIVKQCTHRSSRVSYACKCVKKHQPNPAWKSNLQPDFNVRICDSFDASSSAVLRELDESNRSVQKSAEPTSM
jgi:hypothetical protein